jgi:putative transposase
VRVAAVVALLARERTAGEIAGALGVPRRTLYTWKRELLGEGVPCRMEREHEPGADAAALEARVEELEAQVRKLELRKAILEGTVELLGKDPGADPNRLTNREKTLLIDSIRPDWPLGALLAELGLARSSYQYQVAAIAAGDRRADLRREVREVFEGSGGTYGRRRIRDALAARGVHAGERAVARIMEEEGLVARCSRRRRRGYSSYKGEISEHPGNLVRRDFRAALPNFLWLTDVTQFSIPAGRVYLSPIVDCFDGAVVSWTMSTSPDAELANSMLEAALAKLPDGQGGHLVIHSDCGCHYRWPGWIAICERAGVTRSMSAKGCSPDNAAMEGFFGRLKTEMFYDRDWSGVTVEGFEEEVGAYIRWYNEGRIKRSLGGKSPMEYRASLGLEL